MANKPQLPALLERIVSKPALAKAIELIKAQPTAKNEDEKNANHQVVVDGVLAFVELLDDKVVLIPYVGPILAAFVDTPAVDAKERQLVEFVVELAYQSLKLEGTK